MHYIINDKDMIQIPIILYKRNIINQITPYLFTEDIVVLHGARQVGKTYILYYLAKIIQEKGESTQTKLPLVH